MATTSEFRAGLTIRYNNDLWTIVEFQHVNPGNWRAFVRAKMKNIKTGQVIENRFRAGQDVDVVRIEMRTYQYLYRDGDMLVFMENETFEQISIPENVVGEGSKFLKENENVQISFNGTEILGVEIPIFVSLKVVETEPGLKGDSVNNVMKAAKMETGAVVNVPLFVNEGEVLKVDTRTGAYVERVK
ncbi:MAG: elongation factor P [Bacteroidetes bacterium]|jgi:elongation factor P|nr:elongation factor P [Bacteroidota bacterium]